MVRMRGARPPPFTISTIKCKVVVRVYATAERADNSSYFYSSPICTLWNRLSQKGKKIGSFISQWKGVGDVILAGAMWGQTREYTQNGNGHFLAYISSGWKNHCISTYYSREGRHIPSISTLPLYVLCGSHIPGNQKGTVQICP